MFEFLSKAVDSASSFFGGGGDKQVPKAPPPPAPGAAAETGPDPGIARLKKASPESKKDAEDSAKKLFRAMDGLGTDEKGIHEALAGKSKEEIELIRAVYRDHYRGRDLDKDLASELGDDDLAEAKAELAGDKVKAAQLAIKNAADGLGTDEGKIMRTLEGLKPAELDQLRKDYAASHDGETLDKFLGTELGGSDLKIASALLAGDKTKAEALKLDDAMHGTFLGTGLGTDENAIYAALEKCKDEKQRKALIAAYNGLGGDRNLEKDLVSELDGPEKDIALNLVKGDAAAASAARIQLAAAGAGTDESAIFREFERLNDLPELKGDPKKKAAMREEIIAKFNAAYGAKAGGSDFQDMLKSEMDGLDLARAKQLSEKGEMDPELALRCAVDGVGTDEDLIKKTLKGKSPAEIQAIREAYAKLEPKRDLDKDLADDLSGREGFEITQMMQGEPKTPEEKLARARAAYEFERGWGAGIVGRQVTDMFSDSGKVLDDQQARLEALGERLKKGPASKEDQEEIDKIAGYQKDDVDNYQQARDAVTNTVATVGAAVVGTAVTIATWGTAGPAVAAMLGALIGGETTILTKIAMQGASLSTEELATDLVMTLGQVATAGMAGPLGKLLQLGPGIAATILTQAIRGAASGATSGLIAALLDENTWRGDGNGLVNLLEKVGMQGLGGMAGSVAGGGTGMLFDKIKPAGMSDKVWSVVAGTGGGLVGGTVNTFSDSNNWDLSNDGLAGRLLMNVGTDVMREIGTANAERKRQLAEKADHEAAKQAALGTPQDRGLAGDDKSVSGLPTGAKVVSQGEGFVVYDVDGEKRIRFKAGDALTSTEAAPGRNFSGETGAGVSDDGHAYVVEGRHRAAGAASGDQVGWMFGGVPGLQGVLDYPFADGKFQAKGSLPVAGMQIDNTAGGREADATTPAAAAAKRVNKFGDGAVSAGELAASKKVYQRVDFEPGSPEHAEYMKLVKSYEGMDAANAQAAKAPSPDDVARFNAETQARHDASAVTLPSPDMVAEATAPAPAPARSAPSADDIARFNAETKARHDASAVALPPEPTAAVSHLDGVNDKLDSVNQRLAAEEQWLARNRAADDKQRDKHPEMSDPGYGAARLREERAALVKQRETAVAALADEKAAAANQAWKDEVAQRYKERDSVSPASYDQAYDERVAPMDVSEPGATKKPGPGPDEPPPTAPPPPSAAPEVEAPAPKTSLQKLDAIEDQIDALNARMQHEDSAALRAEHQRLTDERNAVAQKVNDEAAAKKGFAGNLPPPDAEAASRIPSTPVSENGEEQATKAPVAEVEPAAPTAKAPASHEPPPTTARERAALAQLGDSPEAVEQQMKVARAKRSRANLPPEVAHMSDAEIAALGLYTDGGSMEINKPLRTGDQEKIEPVAGLVHLTTSALEKLPEHKGETYRVMKTSPERLAKYKVGQIYEEPGFFGTSHSENWLKGVVGPEGAAPEVATPTKQAHVAGGSTYDIDHNYQTKSVVERDGVLFKQSGLDGVGEFVHVDYVVESSTGRDISGLSTHQNEKEVLFRPGTKFLVESITPNPERGSMVIKLKEVSGAPQP